MKAKLLVSGTVFLLAFLAVVPVARAETITLYPTDDCHVLSYSKFSNFNREYLIVRADNYEGGYIFRSYLKFNLNGIDSERICGATLYLYYQGGGGSGYLDVDAAATGDYYNDTTTPWKETGLTWNNAPPVGDLNVTTAVPFSPLGWYSWDGDTMKNYVKTECAGDGIVSFVMKLTVEDISKPAVLGRNFGSKEHETNKPYLEITLAPQCEVDIPEFALAVPIITSLGAIAIFLRKKR